MGGRRTSGPRWGAITVRRLLLSRPPASCTPHSMDFSRFLSQLLATWGSVHHGSSFPFKMQFSLSAGWLVGAPLPVKVNWMPPIPHGKVISHTFQAFNTFGKALQGWEQNMQEQNAISSFFWAYLMFWCCCLIWRNVWSYGDWQLNSKVLRTAMMVWGGGPGDLIEYSPSA